MNVSYRWLRDMVEGLTLTPEEVAEHLALRGAPVEEIVSPGAGLGDIVIGRVITSGKHPNADRLSLCTVDAGGGETLQVVCGAPNVKEGSFYPFAPVGAVLPGDFKIKKAKIRGEHSQGMLCSAKELGLGADHTGILELPGEYTPGESFVEAMGLNDATLDVEITANRGDLLSHMGIARELASEGEGEARLVEIPDGPTLSLQYLEGTDEASHGGVTIRIEDPDLCHRYLGAVIRGVKIGPSPKWLQERLRGAGSRPINNVVDATNYVMLELGHPMHAFDLSRLADSTIVVRRPGPDEGTFVTLDDEKRSLTPEMLMICDGAGPVGIGGVMGGQNSEVDDATEDVLLECALFQPASIRNTRRALNMSTDASYRFERGVDPAGLGGALERAVALILATAGGEVDGPVLDVNSRPFEAATVALRLSRIEYLLGIPFTSERVRELLAPLGFEIVGENDDTLQVRVPGYRSYDVTREVDLIEEVARTHGYDVFPEELGAYRTGTVPDHPLFQLEDHLRDLLVGRGFFETQTPAFVPEGEGEVRVQNPVSSTEPVMRRRLLPSLLRRIEYNLARGNRDVRFFEIGTSFRAAGSGEPPVEETHIAVAFTGRREPPHWSRPDEDFEVWDLMGLMEDIVAAAYGGAGLVDPAGDAPEPYRAGTVLTAHHGDARTGWGGCVGEDHVDAPAWAGPVWGFEIRLPADVVERPVAIYQPPPQLPGVERDLALLIPHGTPAADLLRGIREAGGELLEAVELFDLYEGEGIPAGTRSVAFRLRFRARDRTLKDKEVDRAVASVTARLKEELGVEQRG